MQANHLLTNLFRARVVDIGPGDAEGKPPSKGLEVGGELGDRRDNV